MFVVNLATCTARLRRFDPLTRAVYLYIVRLEVLFLGLKMYGNMSNTTETPNSQNRKEEGIEINFLSFKFKSKNPTSKTIIILLLILIFFIAILKNPI
jgi:hypothetical protein